jgi:DNA-binding NtrC family response regulator
MSQDGGLQRGVESEFETVRRPKFERPRATYAFELRVVDGADLGLSRTLEPNASTSVLVGSSSICGIRLTGEGVTSRHCSLQIVGTQLRIVDLSDNRSTRVNGTYVVEALLSGGETIRVGETALFVNRVEHRRDAPRASAFGRVRGESSVMRDLFPVLEAATRSLEPVLLHGDRGVGKRLVAEELHRMTSRGEDPGLFVTLPPGVGVGVGVAGEELATLLFAEGGLFEQARGGTLYINDVSLLDEEVQQTLARAMVATAQEPDSVRVRVIVACRTAGSTSAPLTASLGRHFAGATGIRINIPGLRAREADIVALARHFWAELGGEGCLPDDFVMHFEGHAWPGNVRELRVVVQSWIQHGERTSSRSEVVPAVPQQNQDALSRVIESDLPFARARRQIVAEFEKRYVERALTRADHKISRAAAASGIAHRYFQVLKSRCMP